MSQVEHKLEFVTGSRRIQVEIDGVQIAESANPVIVYESSLPPRYYVPEADVDMGYLKAVPTQSHCPYKGDADYYNVEVNNEVYEEIAWTYPKPIPAAASLQGTIAFWPEKDARIRIIEE